jgi:Pyridine nucleotide-disulphide oxidoreductase
MPQLTDTDVAVIGAGPYGLSVSAHLSARGIPHEIFGTPMDTWRRHMPAGMYLKSEGFASNLADPTGEHTLERFCRESEFEYGRQAVPISLDIFSRYGLWFQERLVPKLDPRLVERLRATGRGFELVLDDGESLSARKVVVATGVQRHAYVPAVLRELPPEVLTHTYDHDPAEPVEGGTVVVGAGQSALEAAALVREHGGEVRLVARGRTIDWLSKPGGNARPLRQRWKYPESGLGEGRAQWAYSNHALFFHAAPERWRLDKAFSVLGPAGGWWLKPRIEGVVEARLGRRLVSAATEDGAVRLRLEGPDGPEELVAGRVVAGTGYRLGFEGMPFLDPQLRDAIQPVAGTAVLGRSFQSSVPGLFFVGFPAAPSFGPLMRFVYGADFTARRVVRKLA